MYNSCVVSVRGKLFPSIRAACRYFNVREKTAHRHLNLYGHLDKLGLALTKPSAGKRVACVVYGISFPSVSCAARELGVDRKTIRNMKTRAAAQETVLAAAMRYKQKQKG